MRRFRLMTAMIAIAALAIVLGVVGGLRRRAARLDREALRYGREASRLEMSLVKTDVPNDRIGPILDRAHWCDAVSAAYDSAAARPWVPIDPDPGKIACECGAHAGRAKPGS